MAISSIGTGIYSTGNAVTSSTAPEPTSTNDGATSSAVPTSSAAGNNSSALSLAISQALAQMSGGANLSALFGTDAQQSSADFTSNLLASLQEYVPTSASSDQSTSLLGGSFGSTSSVPVTLDQSSPTYQLQSSIQRLIGQLDGNSSVDSLLGGTDAAGSGLEDLQQSFNSLITASSGNPSQASLKSFLQLVATNIQGSSFIGSLFDASA